MKQIYELIVYRIEETQRDAIIRYMEVIKEKSKTDGIKFVYNYKSEKSYTKNGAKNIYIQLIGWKSIEDKQKHSNKIIDKENYQVLIDLELEPEEGWTHDFAHSMDAAKTMEFGIRRIKPTKKQTFFRRRETFMELIHQNDGAVFDQELRSLDGEYNIMLFGWESYKAFGEGAKTAFSSLKALSAMIKYFPLMKQEGFQVGVMI